MKKTGIASIDKDTETLEALQKRSDKADGLVGKLLGIPHADGHAYYTVEEERGSDVRLEWRKIHDAWQDNVLGAGGWFKKGLITPIIRQQEGLGDIFAKAGRRQENERQKRMRTVVAAALTDLGADAGLYDLAHWCWERRTNHGTKKDARIHQSGSCKAWGTDLAQDLVDSKVFTALKDCKHTYEFGRLADGHEDPLVYTKPVPAKETMLAKVREVFEARLGVVPPALDVMRERADGLMDTTYVIRVNGKPVGHLRYDPVTGNIESVDVGFRWPKEKQGDGEYVRLA